MLRIGRGFSPRDKVLPPNNIGGRHITQQRLDHIISRVNRRHREALKIDGIHAHIWSKVFAGRTCTCQQKTLGVTTGETPARGDQILLPEVEIQGFKIKRLVPPNVYNPTDFTGEVKQILEENKQADLDQLLDDLQATSGELSPQEMAQQIAVPGGALFNEPEAMRCGICLSTGKVNGFNLYNGIRIILDNSGTVPYTTEAWRVDKTTRPHTFQTTSIYNNTIIWSVRLPSYFNKVNVAIRNNTAPAVNVYVEFSKDGTIWLPLSAGNLLQTQGFSGVVQVRARPTITNLNNIVRFTHIEMIYDLGPSIKVQMPQLAQSASQDWASPVITSTMELDGEIYIKPTYTYITLDEKYYGAWLCTDSTNSMTAKSQLFGVEASVMLLQNFQIENLLQVYRDPGIILNYTILESLQGNITGG